MEFALGPCPASDIIAWTKTARRVIVEAKDLPRGQGGPAHDQLLYWSHLVQTWSSVAHHAQSDGECFRWQEEMSPEMAEYLMHGLELCLHLDQFDQWVTAEEATALKPTTTTIVQAFTTALSCEGTACQHFVDQLRGSLPVDA